MSPRHRAAVAIVVPVLVGWTPARADVRAVGWTLARRDVRAEISKPVKVRRQPAPTSEILAMPAVGALYGRCPPSEKMWRLELVNNTPATDRLVLRVGGSPTKRVVLQPGYELPWRLPEHAARTPGPGDNPARRSATTIETTQKSRIAVTQATEPHTVRAQITLALAPAGDGSGNCAPVATRINTHTYFNGPIR
jgi:hypothetical protein